MTGSKIAVTTVESNFKTIIERSMKMSAQCSVAFEKANRMLGKKWRPNQKNIMTPLHRFTVWLHLNSVCCSVPILPAQKSEWENAKMLQSLEDFWREKWSTRAGTFVWENREPGRAHDKSL